jgi:hypothetical protein
MNQSARRYAFHYGLPSVAALALAAGLCFALLTAGCNSVKVIDRERLVNEKLARPGKILIYDFIADPAKMPADSFLAGQTADPAKPPTAEEIEIGRRLGAGMAAQLVQRIAAMGLPAELARPGTKAQLNDIVLRGYILTVAEGDGAKRVIIGFGYGASDLQTAIEGYQMTADGLRRLGAAKVETSGGKSPGGTLGAVTLIARANPVGLIVGGAVKGYQEMSGYSKVDGLAQTTADAIADQLQVRFQEEGWIE